MKKIMSGTNELLISTSFSSQYSTHKYPTTVAPPAITALPRRRKIQVTAWVIPNLATLRRIKKKASIAAKQKLLEVNAIYPMNKYLPGYMHS